jgi:branched-chain amino acid transport system ATP-binding protein
MLEAAGLCAGYGNVPVLRQVSLRLGRGEVLVVAGPNGAGKSTLARAICGFIAPSAGRVTLDGREVTGGRPERLAQAGLRLVFDGHRIFPDLSVIANIRLGAIHRADRRALSTQLDRVFGVFPVLAERLHAFARDLSGGQQQMVALAQAFVGRPRVLVCDEPSLGLAESLMPSIMAFLREWANEGTAILLIEQKLDLALPYADRFIMLDRGQIVQESAAAEVRAARKMARAPSRRGLTLEPH